MWAWEELTSYEKEARYHHSGKVDKLVVAVFKIFSLQKLQSGMQCLAQAVQCVPTRGAVLITHPKH